LVVHPSKSLIVAAIRDFLFLGYMLVKGLFYNL